MKTDELISKLRDISMGADMSIRHLIREACYRLEAQQIRIAQLEAELREEMYRHDRVQDFEGAEAQELAKLRQERRWIPVGERLPEDDPTVKKHIEGEKFGFLTVLVYNGVVKETNRFFSNEPRYGLPKTNGWEWASSNVTHWTPLPEPPEVDG